MQITALTAVFVVVMVILSIATVKTAIPNAQASKPCLIGYKATCSFTPVSTAILIFTVIITFFIARRLAVI